MAPASPPNPAPMTTAWGDSGVSGTGVGRLLSEASGRWAIRVIQFDMTGSVGRGSGPTAGGVQRSSSTRERRRMTHELVV